MRLAHFGHSCVLLETDGVRILFDPGTFSTGFEDVRDLDAVLITHRHPDHIDSDRLPALLDANPAAKLVTDPETVSTVGKLGLSYVNVRAGETVALGPAGELPVQVVGGEHATIHPDIPNIQNIGYVVGDGLFYHPGDSFAMPGRDVDVLGLPTAAPWLKASEAVDFLRAVAPRVAVPIHEAVLAMPQLHYGLFGSLAPEGTEVTVLEQREPTEF